MLNGEPINGASINGAVALDEEVYQLWLRDPAAAVVHLVEIDYLGASAVYPNWITYTLKLCDIAPSFGGYKDVVKTLPTFTRQIGEDFTGTVVASYGELVLDNTNGLLDLWHNLSLDGQKVRVFHGAPDWERNRFRLINECLAEIVTAASWDMLTIRLRGVDYGSNLPIQTSLIPASTFANAASNKPVPKTFGSVFNAALVCIDEVTQIYQWNDGAVTSVSDVRDSGARFRTSQINISAVNAGTDTLSTATPHGFYQNTRVRCDVGGGLPVATNWYDVSWNGSVFCVIGNGSSDAATSQDGITWTQRTLPSNTAWTGIAWNGSVFCAIAGGANVAATSPDGITWALRTLSDSTNWDAIAWNGSVFCAIAGGSAIAATSPDGITWTSQVLPSNTNWIAMVWNGSVFCAISNATSIAATSPDGITWTQRVLPVSSTWRAIAWNGLVFCAISYNSSIAATSPDGITWTQRVLPVSTNWFHVAWNGLVFCAISYNSSIAATSPDGITWTQRVLPVSTLWTGIVWNGSVFCAVSVGINVTTSPDGITWSPVVGTPPAPLVINTDYWVSPTGLTTTDFRLALTRGGSAIDITGITTGAPLVGFHWTADLTNDKVYLDSKPAGALTLDGVAGVLTAGEILPTVLNATNVDAASKAAFIVTCPQTLGIYIRERRNRLDIAEEIIKGLGAWCGRSRYGMLKFGRIEASYASHDFALTEEDMTFHSLTLERLIPPKKRNRVQYRRNWTNQAGTLVAGVSAEQRALFSSDYSVSAQQPLGADEGPAGEEYHALAVFPDAKPSLMALAADADAENDRLDALYYGWGAIFACEVGRIGTEVDIGMVGKVTHSRYGLSGGVRMPVVSIEDRPKTAVLKFFAALSAYSPGPL